MDQEKICKTAVQYNKTPVSPEDMAKLQEVAEGYRQVKNYIYARYNGIGSLGKLYPGYTVQNEMTKSGLRDELAMPSVYFYLALFDALGDIKAQWTRTKSKVSGLLTKNETLTEEEKHYLRFVLKTANAFDAALNQRPIRLSPAIQRKWEELAAQVDTGKLHRYLCRQVRKYHVRPHSGTAAGFSATERAYRYADHGIYISTRQSRQRVFIPLTDHNPYSSQLYVRLDPEAGRVEIRAPLTVKAQTHDDYTASVGVSLGMFTMLTTDQGRRYGEQFGAYQTEYAGWMRRQAIRYRCNRADNPGRKKYQARKERYTARLHGYINQELNRFLRTEKPQAVYIAKLPRPQGGGKNGTINYSVTLWQRGYICKRLEQKCREHSVSLIEVLGKDISRECSHCGQAGTRFEGIFHCAACGYQAEEKTNTARNAIRRGRGGKALL